MEARRNDYKRIGKMIPGCSADPEMIMYNAYRVLPYLTCRKLHKLAEPVF